MDTSSLAPAETFSARTSRRFAQLGHTYTHVLTLLYPTVVLALESEWSMGYGELLVLMTVGNVLFGAGALPAGWLGDRWSTLGMMVVFFIGMGLSAIATGFVSSPLGMTLGLAAIGLFASIYHPVGMAWLVRNAVNRGRTLGLNGVYGSVGVASAGLVAGVLTDWISWRAAFIVPGCVSLLTGLLLLRLVVSGRIADTRQDVVAAADPERGEAWRAFVVLSVTMLLTGLVFHSVYTALPKFFATAAVGLSGGTAAGAGTLAAVVYFLSMSAHLLGGRLADRHSLRFLYLMCYAVLGPVLLAAAAAHGGLLVAATALAVWMNTLAIPVENVLLSHYSPAKWRGTAFGAKFLLSLGVSALAVPLVALVYRLSGGFFWLFVLLGAASLTVAAVGLALPADRKRIPAAEPVATEPAAS